jgi:hypothetical protein
MVTQRNSYKLFENGVESRILSTSAPKINRAVRFELAALEEFAAAHRMVPGAKIYMTKMS